MRKIITLIVAGFGIFLSELCVDRVQAAPWWWTTRGVIELDAITNDYAAVNLGQLKHVARQAYYELQTNLNGGAGAAISNLVFGFSLTNNFHPVNLGQLKTIAKPFYDRLIAQSIVTGYPWTTNTTADDKDYGTANIGQLKQVFGFDLDVDMDGIPGWWETSYGMNPSNAYDAVQDVDGDGLNALAEYQARTNPNAWDTDNDGLSDRDEILANLNPAVAETNTIVGTVNLNASTNALGANAFLLSFNTNALRVLGVGNAGVLKPKEYSVGQATNYTAGSVQVAFYQARTRSSSTGGTDIVRVMFRKIGNSGTPTSVSATAQQAKSANFAISFTPVSLTISGVPATLP